MWRAQEKVHEQVPKMADTTSLGIISQFPVQPEKEGDEMELILIILALFHGVEAMVTEGHKHPAKADKKATVGSETQRGH